MIPRRFVELALVAAAGVAAWFVAPRVIPPRRPAELPTGPPRFVPASAGFGADAQRRQARIPARVLTPSQLIQAQSAAGSRGLVDIGGWAYGTLPPTG